MGSLIYVRTKLSLIIIRQAIVGLPPLLYLGELLAHRPIETKAVTR